MEYFLNTYGFNSDNRFVSKDKQLEEAEFNLDYALIYNRGYGEPEIE